MTGQRTALVPHATEHQKARVRLPLLTLMALLVPPVSGVRSTLAWIFYIVFVALYSLWSLRLSSSFSSDRRLGYLLSLTDIAVLLPLLVWSTAAGMQTVLLIVCAAGIAFTWLADRTRRRTGLRTRAISVREMPPSTNFGPEERDLETGLERAVRMRLRMFVTTGRRFALVVLRVTRFEETTSIYGEDASRRLLAAVARRGMRLLGTDAQHFLLPGGRVAFVFETDPSALRSHGHDESGLAWTGPYDVEGLAMALGRKACERLVDGRRVECVVGWASAPADGLNADDLMEVAESGAQSTAAFRRVAGSRVPLPERARAAVG